MEVTYGNGDFTLCNVLTDAGVKAGVTSSIPKQNRDGGIDISFKVSLFDVRDVHITGMPRRETDGWMLSFEFTAVRLPVYELVVPRFEAAPHVTTRGEVSLKFGTMDPADWLWMLKGLGANTNDTLIKAAPWTMTIECCGELTDEGTVVLLGRRRVL